MHSFRRRAIAVLAITALSLAGVGLSAPAFAAPSASASDPNIVNAGGSNASEIIITISGLSTIYGAKLTFSGLSNKSTEYWIGITTGPSSFTKCGSTNVGLSTGASLTHSCLVGSDSVLWDGGGSYRDVGGQIRFSFPANSLQFAASGPYTIVPQYNGSNLSTIVLDTPKTPQSALTVTSTSGTFNSPLSLTHSGGSGSGAVTYSVTNTGSAGCTVSGTQLTASSAGTCSVTATKASDSTYSSISSPATNVTFAKATRSLTFGATTSYTLAYGATQQVTATASLGNTDGSKTYSASGTACSVSSAGLITVTASTGSCTVSASISEGTNYLAAQTQTQVSVNGTVKAITITGKSATFDFGSAYSPEALGGAALVSPQTVNQASTVFEFTGTNGTNYGPSTETPTAPGQYSITPKLLAITGGSATDYNITYVAGTITINKASRTLAFSGTTTATVPFGDTLTVTATAQSGDGTITYSTASAGCTVNASTGVVTATGNTGTCTISATIAEATNYLAASTTSSFTVTLAKRAITIDVPDFEVAFGDTVSPTRSLTVGSLADSDVISGVTYTYVGISGTSYASSTTKPTAAGTYTVTPSLVVFSAGSSANYTVSFTPGTLTITKRAITLKASNLSVVVKSTITPAYTVTVGSLLQGDVISGVTYSFAGTGSTTYASSAIAPTEPGTYSITPSVAVFSAGNSSNYLVTYAQGTLTISKNEITISVQNLDVAFGSSFSPTYTISSGSLLSGDAISGVTISYRGRGSTTYVLSTNAPSASGTYDLLASDPVFSTGVAANYQITYLSGALTIRSAPAAPAPTISPSPTTSNRNPAATADPTVVSTRPAAPIAPITAQSSGKVMVGGVAVNPVVEKPNGGSSLSVQVGSIQMGMSFDDGPNGKGRVDSGSSAGSSAIPELFIPAGNSSSMKGKGLFPGSTLQIWLGGNESAGTKELARIPVSADGSYDGKIVFASRPTEAPVALGRQVIQMSGFDAAGNQTVVDMVINIAQGPVVPETIRADGSRPALALGQLMATSAGMEEPVQAIIGEDKSGISFAGDSWSFDIGNTGVTVGGSNQAPEIRFREGGSATFSAAGLMPGTTASVWFFSDPVLAGSAEVAEDGTLSIDFRVDSAFVPVGEHTLQLQGVANDGFIVAVNWGVAVEDSSSVLDNTILWMVGAFALLCAVVVVLMARRRRLQN